jgi:hypothetical protein
MMLRLRVSSVLAVAGFILAVSQATEAAADNFGAIAYSASSGAHGYSYDFGSRGEAEERALAECGRGCEVVLWFKNACGALAAGPDHGYGVGWSGSRREAEAIAMRYCRENSSDCEVVRWVCTAR